MMELAVKTIVMTKEKKESRCMQMMIITSLLTRLQETWDFRTKIDLYYD